jgi:hypothetical protein
MSDDRFARRAARGAALAAVLAAAALAPAAAAGPGAQFSGSVYFDYWGFLPEDEAIAKRAPAGVTPEASLKVGVDVTDDLTFSAKACMTCHGVELEHVMLDFMPTTKFNVQAGRLAIPFGEFSNRVDPSGHKTVSAPLIYDMGRMVYGERGAMNLGVVPLPYVDTGVMVYGQVFLGTRIQTWYGFYGVAGMRGGNDLDWIGMRAPPYNDNNRLPSGGGRIAMNWISEPGEVVGDLAVGASYTGGRYDREARLGYHAWAADATLKLGPFTFRGEYAWRRTDLDPAAPYRFELVDPWFRKDGWYAELEHPLGGHLSLVYRYDELRRTGVPLPGAQPALTPDSRIRRYTGGLYVVPAASMFLKASWEYWETTDFDTFHSAHLGIGGAF